MSTGTVTLTLKTPNGTALAGCPVIVAPLTPTGAAAYATGDGHEITRARLKANGSGALSLSLEQTAQISPAGTLYQVTVCPPSGEWPQYTIAVPGAGPYQMMAVIIRPDTGGGGLSTQVVIFTNGGVPLVGQQAMANSLPMVLPSEQMAPTANGTNGANIPSVAPALFNGANFINAQAVAGMGATGSTGFAFGGAGSYLYNGATYDVQRGNTQLTALASAARTTTTSTPTQTAYNARGIRYLVNVTVMASGGLTPSLFGIESISAATYLLAAAFTKITGTGLYVYEVYPGDGAAAGGVTARVAAAISRTTKLTLTVDDATSITYSVSFEGIS